MVDVTWWMSHTHTSDMRRTVFLCAQTTGPPRLSAAGQPALAAAGTSRPSPGGSRTASRRVVWPSRTRSARPKFLASEGQVDALLEGVCLLSSTTVGGNAGDLIKPVKTRV